MKTLPFLTGLPTSPRLLLQCSFTIGGDHRASSDTKHAAVLSSVAEMAPCSSGEWCYSSGPSGMDEQPGLVLDPVLGQNQHRNVDQPCSELPLLAMCVPCQRDQGFSCWVLALTACLVSWTTHAGRQKTKPSRLLFFRMK